MVLLHKSLALPPLHLQPPSTHWQSLQAVLLASYHHTQYDIILFNNTELARETS